MPIRLRSRAGFFKRICLLTFFLCAGLTVAPTASAGKIEADRIFAAASARALDGAQPGYSVQVLDDPAGNEVRTMYYAEDGSAIALKTLRYPDIVEHPVVELHDYRSSTGYRAVLLDEVVRVQSLRLLNNNIQAVVDVREVPVVQPVVLDVGLHRFVLQHWDDIVSGNSVRFSLLNPTEARLVPMLVEPLPCGGSEYLCLRVVLKNFIRRLVAPPVLLTFDKSSRRLLRYSGAGFLSTEAEEALAITLDYRYEHQ